MGIFGNSSPFDQDVDITMHSFPNPNKYLERFKTWVKLAGGKLETNADYEYYKKKKVCDIHFTDQDRNRFRRLNALAVPSLHLPGSSQVVQNVQIQAPITQHDNICTQVPMTSDPAPAALEHSQSFVNPASHTIVTCSTTPLSCSGSSQNILHDVHMEHNYSVRSRSEKKSVSERATSENNTSEEWGLIMEICDRAGASTQNAKDCLRAVMRRLAHPDPHVQVHAATLLDACVANCGRAFHLEVASRDFETEYRRLLSRAQPAVAQRLRALLRKWADGEFKSDPQLDLIPSLHAKLRSEGGEAGAPAPAVAASAGTGVTSAAAAAAQREQEELARAIALSLRESTPQAVVAEAPALYPRVELPEAQPARKVRALYDFEAAEDNELTFMAGEIVHVTDSTDPNWWKGYNERGEGLFPANFVTSDLSEPRLEPEPGTRSVKFADAGPAPGPEVEETACIDEATMDEALALLHEADPEATGDAARETDLALARLEARVHAMGPLVDAALERADRRHARLTQLSADLVDALNLYHSLMRQPPPPQPYPAPGYPHVPPPLGPPGPMGQHIPHAPHPPHPYPPPRC